VLRCHIPQPRLRPLVASTWLWFGRAGHRKLIDSTTHHHNSVFKSYFCFRGTLSKSLPTPTTTTTTLTTRCFPVRNRDKEAGTLPKRMTETIQATATTATTGTTATLVTSRRRDVVTSWPERLKAEGTSRNGQLPQCQNSEKFDTVSTTLSTCGTT